MDHLSRENTFKNNKETIKDLYKTHFCLLGNFRRMKYIEDIGKVKRITCSNRRKFKYKKRK